MRGAAILRGNIMRLASGFLVTLSGVVLVYACGGADSREAARNDGAGEAGEAAAGTPGAAATGGAAGADVGAAGSSNEPLAGMSNGGQAGAGATGNAGGVGNAGQGGADGGGADGGMAAGGAESPSCNETCEVGACVFGQCLGTTTVSTGVNLSETSITPERQCAESPAYAITALSANGATLSEAPGDCLAIDDEVLLINLQGAPNATDNVGIWELLKVSGVAGNAVSFASAKARHYGSSSESDASIGTEAAQQRVALVRVPRFGVLDIPALGSLTANPWNGQVGGVIALRAGQLKLAGSIDASALGYRSGRFSQHDSSCSKSITTEAGESIAGVGTATTSANLGASGGVGEGTGVFNSNSPIGATPGHATAGEAGTNYGTRAAGAPGGVYGNADGSRLTFGSGPGGGLTCINQAQEPVLVSLFFGRAGGIVLVLADEVTLTETGSITASPPDAPRDIAFAGGYILLRGQSLALGTDRVTALGGTGKGVNGPTLGLTNHAGNGYIAVDAPIVTGTTSPVATLLQ
jgi:hypothetical protein